MHSPVRVRLLRYAVNLERSERAAGAHKASTINELGLGRNGRRIKLRYIPQRKGIQLGPSYLPVELPTRVELLRDRVRRILDGRFGLVSTFDSTY